MKKYLIYSVTLFLLIITIITTPIIANAKNYDSNANTNTGSGLGKPASSSDWQRNYGNGSPGGIRITIVDKDGKAIKGTKSYDFLTYDPGKTNLSYKIIHNGYDGAKSKVHMIDKKTWKEETIQLNSLYKFIALYDEYRRVLKNNYDTTETENYSTRLKDEHGYLSRDSKESYKWEIEWLKSLTAPKQSNEQADKKTRAFFEALANVVSKNSADREKLNNTLQATLDLENNMCDKEIYIEYDSMVQLYKAEGKKSALVTLSDMYYLDGQVVGNALTLSPWAIYYDKKVGDFEGVKPVKHNSVDFSSKYDYIDSKNPIGTGMGLDWIRKNGTCNVCNCKEKNGKLICTEIKDKKEVKVTYSDNDTKLTKKTIEALDESFKNKSWYKDLNKYAVYAFASTSDGGKGCCELFVDKYNDLSDTFKKAYNYVCENATNTCDCQLKNNKLVCKEVIDGKTKSVKYSDKNTKIPESDALKASLDSDKYKDLNKYAVYAFASTEEGGRNCCNQFKNTYESGKMNSSWKKAYNTICGGDEEEDTCGTVEAAPVKIDVNNCCSDGYISSIEEYDLKDIFCKSDTLKIDYYDPKNGAEKYYKDNEVELNDYCEMYCTERMTVETPKEMTAINGKYFTLSETSKGTKSPYVDGYRRCKIRISYNEWEEDYKNAVQAQVDAYNEYQEQAAWELMYKEAIDEVKNKEGKKESEATKVECETTNSCTPKADPTKNSHDCSVKYNKYNLDNHKKNYYGVKMVQGANHSSIGIVADSSKNGDTEYDWKAYDFDTSDCDKVKNDHAGTTTDSKGCTLTTSCSLKATEAKAHEENVTEQYANYTKAKNDAENSYKTATTTADNLEKQIDVCDNYFTNYDGKDGSKNYKLDTKVKFYYSQAYINDAGYKEMIDTNVAFKDVGCKVEAPTFAQASDKELEADKYSSIYGTGNQVVKDFSSSASLSYTSNSRGFTNFLGNEYKSSKKFTTDAKYHGTCSWEEEDNEIHTLVPSGYASSDMTTMQSHLNYTIHNREYNVFLSTMEGTYETHWKMTGLGHKGHLDQYFNDAGETCANKDPEEDGTFTCKLKVEHEVVLTGLCNGTDGANDKGGNKVTSDLDDCDIQSEGKNLFNFRTVDEKNLFPQGTTIDGKEYAYNWVKTDAGKKALEEIQTNAKEGKTYSQEKMTYSFTLTSADMKVIRKYNEQQNSKGGYSDFELNCKCENTDVKQCSQCKSTFLYNLANGKVVVGNKENKVTGWSNPNLKTIESVRASLNW